MRWATAGDLADGVIHVSAEGLAAGVAIEQRREDLQGERGRNEQGTLAKCAEHEVAKLARGGRTFGQLDVVFGAGGLMAGGYPAIHPIRGIEELSRVTHLFLRQEICNG